MKRMREIELRYDSEVSSLRFVVLEVMKFRIVR